MADVQLRMVCRPSDMAPDANMVVLQETDGDVIVCITSQGKQQAEVQFCASGGKSPNTRRALVSLMKAMLDDLNGVIPEITPIHD